MTTVLWENRIEGYGTLSVGELLTMMNPENWRLHPNYQEAALDDAMEKVGIIDDIIVNKTTNRVVDGHLRIKRAEHHGVPELPVKYVELDEDEERYALATFNPIGALAETDEQALLELGNKVNLDFSLFFGDEIFVDDEGLFEPSDGSLLALVDVTIDDPRHTVGQGDIFTLGAHTLICADVITEAEIWLPYLVGAENTLFLPYPGPLVPLSLKADKMNMVMVQPSEYIAGHILDRYEDINGPASIIKEVKDNGRN